MSPERIGRKAWLVTWEWAANHAKRDPKVAAVLRPQLSGKRVREFVEFLYGQSEYSLRERVNWTLNPKANPYPAQFGSIGGVPWEGEIICGAHPFLRARLVGNLVINEDNSAAWTERKRPNAKT